MDVDFRCNILLLNPHDLFRKDTPARYSSFVIINHGNWWECKSRHVIRNPSTLFVKTTSALPTPFPDPPFLHIFTYDHLQQGIIFCFNLLTKYYFSSPPCYNTVNTIIFSFLRKGLGIFMTGSWLAKNAG